jgi:hypothetical protein
MSAPIVSPDVLALELAKDRAEFAALELEWNLADSKLAMIAYELRECGQRVERLERQANGPPCADYGAESGVVT